jgi:hypothetical protein
LDLLNIGLKIKGLASLPALISLWAIRQEAHSIVDQRPDFFASERSGQGMWVPQIEDQNG